MRQEIKDAGTAGRRTKKLVELKPAPDRQHAEFRFGELLLARANESSGAAKKREKPEQPLPAEWVRASAKKVAGWGITEEQSLRIDSERCMIVEGRLFADQSLHEEIEKACGGKPPEAKFYYTTEELRRMRPKQTSGGAFIEDPNGTALSTI